VKVLFFSSEFPGPHDPYRALFNRAMVGILQQRHVVRVVCPVAWTEALLSRSRTGWVHPTADSPGVTYMMYSFPPRLGLVFRGLFMWWGLKGRLLRMAAAWMPDVVVAYWAHPDGEAALRLARRLGLPFVQIVGGSDVLLLNRGGRGRRIRRVLTAADAVGAVGSALARELAALGVDSDRIVSLQRPVDSTRFRPGQRSAARIRLKMSSDAAVALWVGRFVPVKGLPELIEALDQLRSLVRTLRAFLIGSGPGRGRCEVEIARRGLNRHVTIIGPVPHDELPHWYQAADVTVLPSLSEGVPNVLLESIACGTPFVASDVGGIREIADETLDRLVSPGDASALAAALHDVLTKRPSSAARKGIPPSPAQFATALESMLHRAVSRDGVPIAEAAS
jgi:teichuronic acid biosynthesis glycosyltransferase TuaC